MALDILFRIKIESKKNTIGFTLYQLNNGKSIEVNLSKKQSS